MLKKNGKLCIAKKIRENGLRACVEIEDCAKQLGNACENETKKEVEETTAKMVEVMESVDLFRKMKNFEEEKSENPEFHVFRCYVQMIMEMILFVRAVRTGDWQLNLKSLQWFIEYFFAHDRINNARMIHLYLAEMKKLLESDPEIYQEFLDGNWFVNKT